MVAERGGKIELFGDPLPREGVEADHQEGEDQRCKEDRKAHPLEAFGHLAQAEPVEVGEVDPQT